MKEVKSPCTDMCIVDEDTGLCIGCLRTSEEIAGWSSFSDDQKRAILKEVEIRKEEA